MTTIDPDTPPPDATPEPEPDPDGYGRTGLPGERATEGHPHVRPARLLATLAVVAAIGVAGGPRVLITVLAVLVMIFLHELGHFVMARRSGMKVTEFMIGFGPRIASFRRGDVEYGLKAIPAGAYVKIVGMANIEAVPAADEAVTYRQQSYPRRLGVAVAGSTMHFLLALVLAFVAFAFVGVTGTRHWTVDAVSPGSAAAAAGIRPGDRVVRIGDDEVSTFAEMSVAARARPGRTVPVVVERSGRRITTTVPIASRVTISGTTAQDLDLYRGPDGRIRVSVPEPVDEASAVGAAGIHDADVVAAVGGVEVVDLEDVVHRVDATRGGTLALTLDRDGREQETSVQLGSDVKADEIVGFLGVGEGPATMPVPEAAWGSVRFFGQFSAGTVTGIGRFFAPSNLLEFGRRVVTTSPTGPSGPKHAQTAEERRDAVVAKDGNRLSSIVGAVMLGSERRDWGEFLMFLVALNIGVGLINLIPLPPFDGGHVAIATYERIRELVRRDGRRYFADANKLLPVAFGVVIVMATVGLMAVYLDLADPIRF